MLTPSIDQRDHPRQPTTVPATSHPFRVDHEYDASRASDGQSRYGSYLRRHINRFDLWACGEITTDPECFAPTAFEIATSPIMSPPYVTYSGVVQGVTFSHSQDDDSLGTLLVSIDLATPPPAALSHDRLPGRWNGWSYDAQADRYDRPDDRDLGRRPSILTTTRVTFPLAPELLHTPAAELGEQSPGDTMLLRGDLFTREAMAAVARLVDLLNERVAPVLELLDRR